MDAEKVALVIGAGDATGGAIARREEQVVALAEAADAVQREGYRSTSPLFRQIVNMTFIRSSEFERVGRGRYRVKK